MLTWYKKTFAKLLGILPNKLNVGNIYGISNLIPFTHFYIYCNLIDPTKTFEATKDITCNSSILNILPLKNVKQFGTQIDYKLAECD